MSSGTPPLGPPPPPPPPPPGISIPLDKSISKWEYLIVDSTKQVGFETAVAGMGIEYDRILPNDLYNNLNNNDVAILKLNKRISLTSPTHGLKLQTTNGVQTYIFTENVNVETLENELKKAHGSYFLLKLDTLYNKWNIIKITDAKNKDSFIDKAKKLGFEYKKTNTNDTLNLNILESSALQYDGDPGKSNINSTEIAPSFIPEDFDKVKKTSESFKKLEELYTGKDEAGTAIKDAIIYGSFTGNEMYSEFDTKNIKPLTEDGKKKAAEAILKAQGSKISQPLLSIYVPIDKVADFYVFIKKIKDAKNNPKVLYLKQAKEVLLDGIK